MACRTSAEDPSWQHEMAGALHSSLSDEVECPDAFVARLEVLLRMVVPVMLGMLRLRLEHHALARQMRMIDHE
jgi:hypothetical protein